MTTECSSLSSTIKRKTWLLVTHSKTMLMVTNVILKYIFIHKVYIWQQKICIGHLSLNTQKVGMCL